MKPTHRLVDRFVLRTAVLPFGTLVGLAAPDLAATCAALRKLMRDPQIREAIFVASPELSTRIDAWCVGGEDPPLERTLIRYVSRMAARATPFGLFSGVATGRVADATRLELASRAEHGRHTRLDNDYLVQLCTALSRDSTLRAELSFVPNSSLYRGADRWRYVEGHLDDAGRWYHLVGVDATQYLDAVLDRARSGARFAELADVLATDPELTREEIDGFLDELVATQLLVPTLMPRVTGPEPSGVLLDMLGALPDGYAPTAVLTDVTQRLDAIDRAHGAPPETYRELATALGTLPVDVNVARLFQVDVFLATRAATIGRKLAGELERAFELTRLLAPAPDDQNDLWHRFREKFVARYETREVPLVEVLDEESGIGFGDAPVDTAQAPLIANLVFPERADAPRVKWGPRDVHMLELVHRALATSACEVDLSDRDVAALGNGGAELPLADTVHFVATVMAASAEAIDRGEVQLRVGGFSSGSATRLLGRFCHGSPEITSLVGELTAFEQRCAPDAILAEIVHLPEGRTGNILARPVLREYEIPYLGESGADREHQIPITDLLVSIAGDRVVLRSQRLGREVRPHLATAHNYTRQSLAIYRFLCSHANQGQIDYAWSWGVLDDAPFLPRVRRGNIVLSRACWGLRRDDLELLEQAATGEAAARTTAALAAIRARLVAAARSLRDRHRLPRWIVVADSDNELPVDFDNALSVESFANLVKQRSFVRLYELLPTEDQLPVTGPEGAHVHELVASFVRTTPPAARRDITVPPVGVPRRFPPGSSWLYAKLYAGTATIDKLLRELVAPFARDVLSSGVADRFFFIRYADPDSHLRLRFHGEPGRLAAELSPRLAAAVAPAIERGLVWRVQLDTYEREVERYGGDHAIELVEELFAADTEAVLAIVETTPGDEGAQARWRLTARGLDQLLADLGLALDERHRLATALRDTFGAEHGMDTAFQRRLGETFRAHREELAALLAAPADEGHTFASALAAFARRSMRIAPTVEVLRRVPLALPLHEIAASLMHMHANRMLASLPRRQELVLYDLLRRHYEGVIARAKAKR